ncbi:MAG: hypothetical protein IJB17_01905 [Oscillospiraceae bacterium]|nr:hypothetical protein [Oscillospiraceae bacterium]
MEKWLIEFLKKPLYARILTAINIVCSAAVLILCLLYLVDVIPVALPIAMPLMGIASLTQGGLFWKKDRGMAIMCIAVGVFILGVAAYILFF